MLMIVLKSIACIVASLIFSFFAAAMGMGKNDDIDGPFVATVITVTALLSWFLIKFGVLTGIF
jgi:hypothetical protein